MLLDLWLLLEDEELLDFIPSINSMPPPRRALPVLRLPDARFVLPVSVVSASALSAYARPVVPVSFHGSPVAAYASPKGAVGVSASGIPQAVYGLLSATTGVAVAVAGARRAVTPWVDDDLILALLMED